MSRDSIDTFNEAYYNLAVKRIEKYMKRKC